MAAPIEVNVLRGADSILQEDLELRGYSRDGEDSSNGMALQNTIISENVYTTRNSNFVLDREKAMQAKIQAATREDVLYEHTGGGHRITFSSGTYELVKNALPDFYEQNKNFNAKFRNNVDTVNSVIDVMITVHNVSTGYKLFTINMYNPTSRFLVNGKNPDIFRQHLNEVLTMTKQADADDINTALQNMAQNTRRSNRHKTPSLNAGV